MTTNTNAALAEAERLLRRDAESLREGHTSHRDRDDLAGEDDAKAGYDEYIRAADALAALTTAAAPAAVASPLTKLQRKAIAVCFTSDKVSVSEVQRKLSISYADAQTLCQSIVDLGLTDELGLAPSLKRGAPAPHPAPVAQGDAPTDSGPISRQWLTVVYRGVEAGDEVQQICTHPKVSAMSWSHALHDRDVARSQAKEGA